jgi:hypothetical protein
MRVRYGKVALPLKDMQYGAPVFSFGHAVCVPCRALSPRCELCMSWKGYAHEAYRPRQRCTCLVEHISKRGRSSSNFVYTLYMYRNISNAYQASSVRLQLFGCTYVTVVTCDHVLVHGCTCSLVEQYWAQTDKTSSAVLTHHACTSRMLLTTDFTLIIVR